MTPPSTSTGSWNGLSAHRWLPTAIAIVLTLLSVDELYDTARLHGGGTLAWANVRTTTSNDWSDESRLVWHDRVIYDFTDARGRPCTGSDSVWSMFTRWQAPGGVMGIRYLASDPTVSRVVGRETVVWYLWLLVGPTLGISLMVRVRRRRAAARALADATEARRILGR